jgi:hypothetical protein
VDFAVSDPEASDGSVTDAGIVRVYPLARRSRRNVLAGEEVSEPAVWPGGTGGGVIAGWSVTRVVAGAIGVGSVAVGSFQFVAPQHAARRFGIRLGSDPTSTIMVRGTGTRDVFIGSALFRSAICGGDYQPWLAMRAAADAADGLAGALSILAGADSVTQTRTTRSALLLSGIELLLWRTSTRDRTRPAHPRHR